MNRPLSVTAGGDFCFVSKHLMLIIKDLLFISEAQSVIKIS